MTPVVAEQDFSALGRARTSATSPPARDLVWCADPILQLAQTRAHDPGSQASRTTPEPWNVAGWGPPWSLPWLVLGPDARYPHEPTGRLAQMRLQVRGHRNFFLLWYKSALDGPLRPKYSTNCVRTWHHTRRSQAFHAQLLTGEAAPIDNSPVSSPGLAGVTCTVQSSSLVCHVRK